MKTILESVTDYRVCNNLNEGFCEKYGTYKDRKLNKNMKVYFQYEYANAIITKY